MIDEAALLAVARRARMLALDFDGILTDGSLHLHAGGEISKTVCYLDIVGLTRWRRLGHALCVITGDGISPIPAQFTNAFKIPKLLTGRMDKLNALTEAASEFGIPLDQTIYMGDDVMDLPAMRAAALGATVPTAHPHVLDHADWVSARPAGNGAVRELTDLILTTQGHHVTELRPQKRPHHG